MDITKLKTRLRFRSAKKTTNQASLTDVVNDFEAVANELNTVVKVTSSASGVERLLEKHGVVGSLTTDDASNFQEFINEARTVLNGAIILPSDFKTLRLDSGITLVCDTDRLSAMAPVTVDASRVTSGNVITLDGSITDTNAAPFRAIMGTVSDLVIQGAGSTTVAGAAGVAAIKVRGNNGKAYFNQTRRVTLDGFSVGVDLAGESFGNAFEDMVIRSALGGTCVQSLTGDGTNYGERWNFIRCMLFNSTRAVYNTTTSADLFFIDCSFDYSDVMVETTAARISLIGCHIETNKDTDYLFKVGGNEATSLSLSNCNIVQNATARNNYEFFDIADTVVLGGISFRDGLIAHSAGYGLPSYVRGAGRASAQNIYSFIAQPKVPFSRSMNLVRDGFADGTALAEWTLTGAVPPVLGTIGTNDAVSMKFGNDTALSQAELALPLLAGQTFRGSCKYQKDGSPAAGQAKFQIVLLFLDNKGTQIGSGLTLKDIDGNNTWAVTQFGPQFIAPAGTRSAKLRFIKSADTGNVGRIFVDEIVVNVIPN